jgi:hypothetical protein
MLMFHYLVLFDSFYLQASSYVILMLEITKKKKKLIAISSILLVAEVSTASHLLQNYASRSLRFLLVTPLVVEVKKR